MALAFKLPWTKIENQLLGGSERTNILSIIGNGQQYSASKLAHKMSPTKSFSLETIHLDHIHKRGFQEQYNLPTLFAIKYIVFRLWFGCLLIIQNNNNSIILSERTDSVKKEWVLASLGSSNIESFLKGMDATVNIKISKIDCGLWDQRLPIFIIIDNFDEIDKGASIEVTSWIKNGYFLSKNIQNFILRYYFVLLKMLNARICKFLACK